MPFQHFFACADKIKKCRFFVFFFFIFYLVGHLHQGIRDPCDVLMLGCVGSGVKLGSQRLFGGCSGIDRGVLKKMNWEGAYWPTSENVQKKKTFFYFSGPQKSLAQNGPKWGQKDFFILIQTLPTFWATRILILRIFIFWICLAPPWGGPQVGARVGPRVNAGAEIQQVPKDKISRMKILFCHLNTDRQETRASNQGPRTKSWTKISTLVPFYLYPK